MTHEILVSAGVGADRLVVWCRCNPDTLFLYGSPGSVFSLAQLNEIAHEHIEAAERAPVAAEGYRAESAVRSEDELVDIETGLYRRQT